jgi:hypothetical protein
LWTEELPRLPSNEVLVRLLSCESKVLETHVTIGVVVRGEPDLSKKFKAQHAIHMTFIWPINGSGRGVRQTEIRVFLWNDEYGWFNAIVIRRRLASSKIARAATHPVFKYTLALGPCQDGSRGGHKLIFRRVSRHRGEPLLPSEPGALSFGVLARGNDNEFCAFFAIDFSGEEAPNFRDPDRLGRILTELGMGCDFLNGTFREHLAGAQADALFEGRGPPSEEHSAEVTGIDLKGRTLF